MYISKRAKIYNKISKLLIKLSEMDPKDAFPTWEEYQERLKREEEAQGEDTQKEYSNFAEALVDGFHDPEKEEGDEPQLVKEVRAILSKYATTLSVESEEFSGKYTVGNKPFTGTKFTFSFTTNSFKKAGLKLKIYDEEEYAGIRGLDIKTDDKNVQEILRALNFGDRYGGNFSIYASQLKDVGHLDNILNMIHDKSMKSFKDFADNKMQELEKTLQRFKKNPPTGYTGFPGSGWSQGAYERATKQYDSMKKVLDTIPA